VSEVAGELGRRFLAMYSGMDVADLIVAALAGQLGGELKTTNVKHFPIVKGLKRQY
jgi:predicted nucleic acid-binding protein